MRPEFIGSYNMETLVKFIDWLRLIFIFNKNYPPTHLGLSMSKIREREFNMKRPRAGWLRDTWWPWTDRGTD